MKDKVRNKLSNVQAAARGRGELVDAVVAVSLQAQRMSVALQLAAAEETELRLAAASEDAAVA